MFEKSSLDIPCPKCGHKSAKTIAWLKTHNNLTCGNCQSVIALKTDGLMRGLEKADKIAKDFGAAIKRASKNISIKF